uniref:Uncharacterized protein n=1 Tax=Setaria viridis TaxID=4556 RepID=A0A4U6VVY3_SETVI|nr:hypothetical protein SEVIR_2G283600v2 [Setaria viridis]
MIDRKMVKNLGIGGINSVYLREVRHAGAALICAGIDADRFWCSETSPCRAMWITEMLCHGKGSRQPWSKGPTTTLMAPPCEVHQ